MAHREISPLTDPTVQISRSGFLKQDSPVSPRHGEAEVAATDDVVEARCSAPTSSGFRACDDSATSSRSWGFTPQSGLHYILEPFVEHVVQVDVGQEWTDGLPLSRTCFTYE